MGAASGRFVWYDVMTTDLPGAKAFYSDDSEIQQIYEKAIGLSLCGVQILYSAKDSKTKFLSIANLVSESGCLT